MSRPSQEEMEASFSQRNIHDVLHRTIAVHLDKEFLTWTIGVYFRISTYLEGVYYQSKQDRIHVLQQYINKNGLEAIIVAILAATIRSKKDQTIQQVIGYLQTFMPHVDHFDRAKTAGELIAVCAGPRRIFSIERPINDEAPYVVVNHWPTINQLFAAQFEWIDTTFFNPPLVTPPKEITNNRSCGYYTFDEPIILGKNTQHKDALNFKTLNTLAKIPWVLDSYVMAETEHPPATIVTQEDLSNFQQHMLQARKIYNILGSDRFWLTWQYDSRGRIYSHGHHVNFQSYAYKKAMLNFDHYEILT